MQHVGRARNAGHGRALCLLALWPAQPPGRRRADAGRGRCPQPLPDARPNIVVVMLDDFSMDLVADDAVGAADAPHGCVATRTRSSPTRCAACRGRASSPASTPTRPASCTNTSNEGQSTLGGWARLRRQRQPRARLQRAAAGVGLHDRFRRQVPQRVRVVAGPRAAAGRAGLVDLQHRLRLGLRRVGLRQHVGRRRTDEAGPARRTAREREQQRQGQGVRRHGDRRPGDGLPGRERGRGRAVLPRGLALRAPQPHPARGPLPGRPALPADVPRPRGRPRLRAGGVPQADRRRPAGLRRRREGQPAAHGRRREGPGVEHRRPAVRGPSPSATCATARGCRSPPTG